MKLTRGLPKIQSLIPPLMPLTLAAPLLNIPHHSAVPDKKTEHTNFEKK